MTARKAARKALHASPKAAQGTPVRWQDGDSHRPAAWRQRSAEGSEVGYDVWSAHTCVDGARVAWVIPDAADQLLELGDGTLLLETTPGLVCMACGYIDETHVVAPRRPVGEKGGQA